MCERGTRVETARDGRAALLARDGEVPYDFGQLPGASGRRGRNRASFQPVEA